MLLISKLWAWLIFLSILTFNAFGTESRVIERAMLLTPAGSQSVTLPYVLVGEDFPATGGRVRLRLEAVLPAAPQEPLGVYVPKLSLSGGLSLNGTEVAACGPAALEDLRCLHQPQLFIPPVSLWHAGANILEFELFANDRQMNGLTPVRIGPVGSLYRESYLPRWLWQVELLRGMTWLAVSLGVLAFGVGWLLKSDRIYLWFGLCALVNALSNLNVLITTPPVGYELFSWFVFSTRMATTPISIGMLLAFFHRLGPRMEGFLGLCALAMPLLVWLSGSNRGWVSLLYLPMLASLLAVTLASIRWAWCSNDQVQRIVSGLNVTLMGISILDFMRLRGSSTFEGVYGITYAFTGFMLVFGGLLMSRLASALVAERKLSDELARYRDELEDKVVLRTAELQTATQQLVTKERAKSLFLAHMSHEIRTPMSGILGMTELALHERPKAKLRHYLEVIKVSAQSLLEILNDILDFSKIEAGKVHIERMPVDVRKLLEQLRVLMEPTASGKRLSLTVDVDPDLDPYVMVDSLRLRQVLANLLGNAIKFTEAGGVVLQVSSVGPDRLRFAVIDTGVGLTLVQRQGLFEAFSQADVSITRRYGGTGLGLAISQQLVTLMGGRIGVESEAGQGSCFSFEIEATTCAAPPESAAIPRPDADQLAVLAGRRVLLVEDDPINREFVQTILERHGVRVALAGNGQEAWAPFQAAAPPELILMDIRMPVMDGYETSRRIRALDERVPIIALSANAYEEDVRQSLAAGMNEHVSKPVNADRLLGLLVKYLGAGNPIVSLPVAPASEAHPEESDWPLIEGIDRNHAFRTMSGHCPLFLRLLRVFVKHYLEVVEQTRQALALGQRQEAIRLMHSLSGAAGQIGALDLRDAAEQAEKGLKEGASDAETQVLAVAVPLRRLLEGAGKLQEQPGPETGVILNEQRK
jgi:signal transduction histidine kinase/CheY-like chemotaxis protein